MADVCCVCSLCLTDGTVHKGHDEERKKRINNHMNPLVALYVEQEEGKIVHTASKTNTPTICG